jgi:immune inhibitor A
MPKINRIIFVSIILNLFLSSISYSLVHKDGTRTGPKDYVRKKPQLTNGQLRSLGLNPEKIQGVISPAIGTKKIAVILAEFSSAGFDTSGAHELTAIDITGFATTMDYMKNFYLEASYNQLVLEYTYFSVGKVSSTISTSGTETPYVMPHSMAYYGNDTDDSLSQLIIDALNAAGSEPSSTNYDAVIVAHAGYGNESTNNEGDIWSAVIGLIGPFTATNGFTDGANVPAREWGAGPIGVTCHEFGHVLGLPDVYSTTSDPESKVGKWCLMDYGPWVNNGNTPPHPSAWCKKYLGWITPVIVDDAGAISDIEPIETSSTHTYQLPILGSSQEYFLVCFSTKSTYNPSLPGGGVLIWHVDESPILDENTNTYVTFSERMDANTINNYSHNTLDIKPADDTHPSNYPYGDSTDPWPGIKSLFTTPESNSYSGQSSGISIANMTFSQNKANFSVSNIAMTAKTNITKIINYPNPAGKGYPHPSSASGIITTFSLDFTRAPSDMSLTIYNAAGDKVIKITDNQFTLNLNASANNKIIYEYEWDGKNEDFEDVAPGLYFYRVKADNEVKSGKMAIVR